MDWLLIHNEEHFVFSIYALAYASYIILIPFMREIW
jgi:hypothetical protein